MRFGGKWTWQSWGRKLKSHETLSNSGYYKVIQMLEWSPVRIVWMFGGGLTVSHSQQRTINLRLPIQWLHTLLSYYTFYLCRSNAFFFSFPFFPWFPLRLVQTWRKTIRKSLLSPENTINPIRHHIQWVHPVQTLVRLCTDLVIWDLYWEQTEYWRFLAFCNSQVIGEIFNILSLSFLKMWQTKYANDMSLSGHAAFIWRKPSQTQG